LEAIETLVLVMRNGKPGEAMTAAQTLLDRAWGKVRDRDPARAEARAQRDEVERRFRLIMNGAADEVAEERARH
jgi:hypothetical protein